MSCPFGRPMYVKSLNKTFSVPCRNCMTCRLERRRRFEMLAQTHLYTTYRHGGSASFATLTYSPEHLPPTLVPSAVTNRNISLFNRVVRRPAIGLKYHAPHTWNFTYIGRYSQSADLEMPGSLVKKDLQDFLKRVRRRIAYHAAHKSAKLHGLCKVLPADFKVVYSGEYGDDEHRPHYHVIVFGIGPSEFMTVARTCWDKGIIDVGALDNGGLRYVISYLDSCPGRKRATELYYLAGCEPPFFHHSVGIGREYFCKHLREILRNNGSLRARGYDIPYPPAWLKLVGFHRHVTPAGFRASFAQAVKSGFIRYDGHKGKSPNYDYLNYLPEILDYQKIVAYDKEYNAINAARKKNICVSNDTMWHYQRDRVFRGKVKVILRQLDSV